MGRNLQLRLINGEYRIEEALSTAALKINGSIAKHNGRYYCAYRTDHLFNYDAKNQISALGANFDVSTHKSIKPEDKNTAIEDIRLFSYRGKLMATYTYLPMKGPNQWEWSYGVAIAEVDLERGLLVKQQSFRQLAIGAHEKNWVPYIWGAQLYMIASFSPRVRVIAVSGDVGDFSFKEIYNAASKTSEWRFGELRGGTPLIINAYKKDQWLYGFLHSSILLPNGNAETKFYFYTVFRLCHENMQIEYYKRPLNYSKSDGFVGGVRPSILNSKDINMSIKVVFPIGLADYNEGLLLSYGKDDVTTRMKFYSWNYILNLFNDRKQIEIM